MLSRSRAGVGVVAAIVLATAAPASSATAPGGLTLISDRGGAYRLQIVPRTTWVLDPEQLVHSGAGTTTLVISDPRARSVLATSTSWAPLPGQPGSRKTELHDAAVGTGSTWRFAARRTLNVTLICPSKCKVQLPTSAAFRPSVQRARQVVPNARTWSQPINTAGVPGGAVTFQLPPDLSGIAIAATVVVTHSDLPQAQSTADVCRVSDLPQCDRFENAYATEQSAGTTSMGESYAYRVVRLYGNFGNEATTLHRATDVGVASVRADLIFCPV